MYMYSGQDLFLALNIIGCCSVATILVVHYPVHCTLVDTSTQSVQYACTSYVMGGPTCQLELLLLSKCLIFLFLVCS